jgi:hypothetical protein
MKPKYEYKFVRLGEGWRLVHVFAPGTGAYGAAKYYELILERAVSN